ncbi:hypothetical protein PRIPAC_74030 [Pristionchus pacificus]|uniref:Uncharacterized protein n=1 Tax=Pristionchus pacificus TaxID=54126 RepID=A0A2A6C010_PRIPA|nr:hypothetical protein PRIPAC_74030 [Pristionchus pacificus]|eukprot:PDM71478.1 hypothetical protein PRIPAC_37885 [Pristionchus pacificus]
MTLNVNWVTELVMKNMNAIPVRDNRASNTWRFSVDQPIDFGIISQQIRRPEVEYAFEHNLYTASSWHRERRMGKLRDCTVQNIEVHKG